MVPETIGQSAPEWWTWWAANSEPVRNYVLSIGAILGAFVGLPLLVWRTWNVHRQSDAALEQAETAAKQAETAALRHEAQVEADRERRITDSFTRAVDQLGSGNLASRLGAIYSLERIARESQRDHWPIMETLTAFIRDRVPWTDQKEEQERDPDIEVEPPPTDVQAALTVIGRRNVNHEEGPQRLLLAETDLRKADLDRADLAYAILTGVNLRGSSLRGAHLSNAELEDTRLEGACLDCTRLDGANLRGARLAQVQLDSAFGDDDTKLPEGLETKKRSMFRRKRRPSYLEV